MPLEPLTVEQARRLGISMGGWGGTVGEQEQEGGDRPPVTRDDAMLDVESHLNARESESGAPTAAWLRQGTRGLAVLN